MCYLPIVNGSDGGTVAVSEIQIENLMKIKLSKKIDARYATVH